MHSRTLATESCWNSSGKVLNRYDSLHVFRLVSAPRASAWHAPAEPPASPRGARRAPAPAPGPWQPAPRSAAASPPFPAPADHGSDVIVLHNDCKRAVSSRIALLQTRLFPFVECGGVARPAGHQHSSLMRTKPECLSSLHLPLGGLLFSSGLACSFVGAVALPLLDLLGRWRRHLHRRRLLRWRCSSRGLPSPSETTQTRG